MLCIVARHADHWDVWGGLRAIKRSANMALFITDKKRATLSAFQRGYETA